MACKCSSIISYMEKLAPKKLSEKWDNTGLLIGNVEQDINKIIVSLDVTPEVVDEAVSTGSNMIITHHPIIFKPLNSVTSDTPLGKMIYKLIQNNICVYSAHTNLDAAAEGVNQTLAKMLELKDIEILEPTYSEKLKKIVVFVPEEHVERVRDAMALSGAGFIGKYRDCSFMAKGKGTFRPLEGANPFIGKVGELEQVEEYRLETITTESSLGTVLNAMLDVHPYEEPAYEVYNIEGKSKEYGFARIGKLEQKMDLVSFAATIKKILELKKARFIGDINATIKNVVVSSGSYSNIVKTAKQHGADVIVTGDLKYHDAREILDYGMCAIDAGHFGTENIIIPIITDYLKGIAENVEIIKSEKSKDIFMVL